MTDPASVAPDAPPPLPVEETRAQDRTRRNRQLSKRAKFRLEEEASTWLITYADMITVLLSLFVILVSMMSYVKLKPETETVMVPEPRLQPVFIPVFAPYPNPLAQYGDGATDRPPPLPVFEQAPTPQQPARESWAARASRQLEESFGREKLGREVAVQQVDQHVVVRLGDSVLFDSGRADLRADGAAVLFRLGPVLKRLDGFVRVEGHTDNVPIATQRFPSNWELSAGRAGAVVRQLIDAGMPAHRVEAVGFADTRPLARGDTEAARALNRRVSFVILPPDGLP